MSKTETADRIFDKAVENNRKNAPISKDCSLSEFRDLLHAGPEKEDYKKHGIKKNCLKMI